MGSMPIDPMEIPTAIECVKETERQIIAIYTYIHNNNSLTYIFRIFLITKSYNVPFFSYVPHIRMYVYALWMSLSLMLQNKKR